AASERGRERAGTLDSGAHRGETARGGGGAGRTPPDRTRSARLRLPGSVLDDPADTDGREGAARRAGGPVGAARPCARHYRRADEDGAERDEEPHLRASARSRRG